MTISGKLERDETKVIPLGTPPYPTPIGTRHYTGLNMLSFTYRTDGNLAANHLPEFFEVDDNPLAAVSFNHFSFSNAGQYREFVQSVEVTFNDERFFYPTRLYLDSDSPMIAGRERFGIPKLSGVVTMDLDSSFSVLSASLERPRGILLATGVFRPDQYIGDNEKVESLSRHWRYIAPSKSSGSVGISELVQTKSTASGGTLWSGTGSPHFTGASAVDPVHNLPVLEVVDSKYWRGADYLLQDTGNTVQIDH